MDGVYTKSCWNNNLSTSKPTAKYRLLFQQRFVRSTISCSVTIGLFAAFKFNIRLVSEFYEVAILHRVKL